MLWKSSWNRRVDIELVGRMTSGGKEEKGEFFFFLKIKEKKDVRFLF